MRSPVVSVVKAVMSMILLEGRCVNVQFCCVPGLTAARPMTVFAIDAAAAAAAVIAAALTSAAATISENCNHV